MKQISKFKVFPDTRPSIPVSEYPLNTCTHRGLRFKSVPRDIIGVSCHVNAEYAPTYGLNYFAIQINFPNNTWAHGGILLLNNKYLANWGGLVNRFGKDYEEMDPPRDIFHIQNPVGEARTGPYAWTLGAEYAIEIERGELKHLPPGDYKFFDETTIHVAEDRTMWEWHLQITPIGRQDKVFSSTLLNESDRINEFFVWNECDKAAWGGFQSAYWSVPLYRTLQWPAGVRSASEWSRFRL